MGEAESNDEKQARPFIVAISSRAMFDFAEEDEIFRTRGTAAFRSHQREMLHIPAKPGVAFGFARKILELNILASPDRPVDEAMMLSPVAKVVLLSRNDAISGIRSILSAKHYGLPLDAGVFACGESPLDYIREFEADLFLSADGCDVANALAEGHAAGLVWPNPSDAPSHPHEIRIAFDADCVLFDRESEDYFQKLGGDLEATLGWRRRESILVDEPMGAGPMKPFLDALHRLRERFPDKIRIGIFTARDVGALERCLRTLNTWGIDVDAAFPLSGRKKAGFLEKWKPDLFFDDSSVHCGHASKVVPTAQVPTPPSPKAING
jgi:5'-nucleotidase